MSQLSHVLIGVLLAVSALLAGSARAESGLLSGSLGQWLDQTAAPELAEILARHPKFKGETVRFVPLHNGKPMATGNLLNQAVEQRLTQQLLRREGVRLAWQDDPARCAVPQDIVYLLGVEIQGIGSRNHRLNIAMVDVQEGVWVSGVSLSWEGRLSTAERVALGREVVSGQVGSTENPLPVREGTQISKIMLAGMRCALPGGLNGLLYVATPAQPHLADISQSLTRALGVSPFAAITPDREGAEWILRLSPRPPGATGQQIVATLQDTTSDAVTQQVASVFVTGLEQPMLADAPAPDTAPIAQIAQAERPQSVAPVLLTRLSVQPSAPVGICDASKARVNTCVEVEFQLLHPAYLLVLWTQDQRLRSQTCGGGLRLAQPGERRYRLRVPPTHQPTTQPDAGVYVLAVENRNVAQRIASHLNRAPGACASVASTGSLADWLRGLDELIARYAQEVDWRATHLRHATNGVVAL